MENASRAESAAVKLIDKLTLVKAAEQRQSLLQPTQMLTDIEAIAPQLHVIAVATEMDGAEKNLLPRDQFAPSFAPVKVKAMITEIEADDATRIEKPGNKAMIEWVRVEPNTVVVATSERTWLHCPNSFEAMSGDDPFALTMLGAGSLETTRRLLDGVIAAAQSSLPRVTQRPPLTAARWAWRLAGYYHTTHATPPLMAEAAKRFAEAGRVELAEYAFSKVEDEGGHDRLALKDLSALGYDAEAVVAELIPPTAAALVDYFTRSVRAESPVGCVGYAYALERLATTNGQEYLRQVEAILPPGVRATRCLRVHSAVSADAQHVEDALQITASLAAEDRRLVAQACYETTRICCSPPSGGHITEAELQERLSGLTSNQWAAHRSAA
jgi:pyrroloquinoline quinone (PQQ) biosynthesis protein C